MNEARTYDYDNYEPFATPTNELLEKGAEKCFYCNKNINANCHAHNDSRCPYSCNYQESVPVGDGLITMIVFIFIYIGIKLFRK